MLNLYKFLMLSAVCATPLLASDGDEFVGKLSGDGPLVTSTTSSHAVIDHAMPGREKLLEVLKYVGPILQSRIDYENQFSRMTKDILELKKSIYECNITEYNSTSIIAKDLESKKQRLKSRINLLTKQQNDALVKLEEFSDYKINLQNVKYFYSERAMDSITNHGAMSLFRSIQESRTDKECHAAINELYE